MRIAFYAPMKAPDHPLPSGDRQIARLLMSALSTAGHDVEYACRFRSFDGRGDALRQARLEKTGSAIADRLVARYASRPPSERPKLWFTYHLYHKGPDWLGPTVSRRLDIPYVVCEASHAPKQAKGPWAGGYRAAAAGIAAADLVIGLNADDGECILPLLADPAMLQPLAPFIDASPARQNRWQADGNLDPVRRAARADIRCRFGVPDDQPWLLSVAMMRRGDKLASYRLLADALDQLPRDRWRMIIAGDGPAAQDVQQAFASHADRIAWLGLLPAADLSQLYEAADIYVWPAINEAFGLSFIEAQAGGTPVVAGQTRGVPDVVADGETGLLTQLGDSAAFAAAISRLLDDKALRLRLGKQARQRVIERHDLPVAAKSLDRMLAAVIEGRNRAR